jgi:uncharacterized protein YkwD
MFYHAPLRGSAKGRKARLTAVCLALSMLMLFTACSCSSTATPQAPGTQATPAQTAQPLAAAAVQATPSPSRVVVSAMPTASAPTVQAASTRQAMKTAVPTAKPAPRSTPKPCPKKSAAPPPKKTAAPAKASGIKALENSMISLVNGERKKAGLKPLAYDAGLRSAALKHSQDMLDNNYFDHTSPVYGTFQQRLAASGVKCGPAGENIAYYPSMEKAHVGLMNSPGHRANILNTGFTRIGIGIVYDKDKSMYYITQWFAG